jgi:ribose transport system ATP-binding protein
VRDEPLLELENVSKSFGPTRALREVSFELRPGEVHVLAGENGAGKSTLIRVLAGAIGDFQGRLLIRGVEHRFRSPADAARAGIASIHQELSLVGSMSVTDNLLLGARDGALWLSPRARRRDAERLLAAFELDVDPDRRVESLPLSTRQLLEIARALRDDASVLVMDEPTSALSEAETERLFALLDELLRRGKGVVYISHRLEEIYRIAQRISVLRDGARVLTRRADELPRSELVAAMIGRELAQIPERKPRATDAVALSVTKLSARERERPERRIFEDVTFDLRRGEVLGLAGLQGAGSSECLHALFGSEPMHVGGSVRLDAAELVLGDPRAAIRRGLVLLGSDRATSLVSTLSVVQNATLSSLERYSRFGWLSARRELEAAEPIVQRLKVALRSLDAPVSELSGGNQQKVAFARCLLAQPRVLLLDDPTRGIDVGARADVYALIDELAGRGLGIVLVASELEELLLLCDRIVVFARGRINASFERARFEREAILHAAMGEGAAA